MALVRWVDVLDTVTIGPNIKIGVIGRRGNQIRLMIEAPKDAFINHEKKVLVPREKRLTAKAKTNPKAPPREPAPRVPVP